MNDERSKPRILIIAASQRALGGQAVMAHQLLADLREDGYRVGFVPVDPRPPGILHHLESIKFVRTAVRTFFYLIALLRAMPNYDVIHIFSASYSSFLISPAPAILLSRFFRKAAILNYHSGEAEDHLAHSWRITKWLMRLPACIVVPSPYLVSVFQRFGFSAAAIPNYLAGAAIAPVERKRVQPKLLMTRALEPLYNIPCALRAFRLVKNKYPQAELTIAGEGSQRDCLQRLAAELDLDNVTFAGRIERAEIGRYYEKHDVFLNTSSVDNMPVSILEAFAAGMPIVSTAAGGIPFIVTDRLNGCLVGLDDHAAAAERIIELIENPAEAARLSRAGLVESKKYTWRAVAGQWKELYRTLSRTPEFNDPLESDVEIPATERHACGV
ncbi:MAG: glycosyltransferase family 4 protein [Pirellulales bacterium]|nr:glycosyltransferase family 4 protein [Pirellulales bacterium]